MTTESKVTREIVERFHNAFEKHRPADLDDLIGEGCVLENTAPAPDGARYEGREACITFSQLRSATAMQRGHGLGVLTCDRAFSMDQKARRRLSQRLPTGECASLPRLRE